MTTIADDRRLSLLWRTILLLTLFVVITQIFLYLWIQHSVKGHFEQMDSETLTHAAFNVRQRLTANKMNEQINSNFTSSPINEPFIDTLSSPSPRLDYEVKIVFANSAGQIISSSSKDFSDAIAADSISNSLWQRPSDQVFNLQLAKRHYRALIIENSTYLALIALPTDVHHHYLMHFNRQLVLILLFITLLLVSVAAFSVYFGFAPLATFSHKMQRINAEQLDDRIEVSKMPSELRALATAYNAMMDKLEHNFVSLSRFSDDIAHELRTPLATLSTQTQVMLSKPRESYEYIEQLHHQHDTLEQLSSLINNMLLLAKTQKGLYNSQLKPVDTDTLINKLIEYWELMAEDRRITFEKTGDFKTVLGEDSLLQRLFANLISNAVYYAAANSVITIQTSTAHTPTMSKIIISNRLAQPLTQIEADKLSNRFYRHDKDNAVHVGTGLGLSIVQAIAYAHKGHVSITVNEGYNFVVSVELPVSLERLDRKAV